MKKKLIKIKCNFGYYYISYRTTLLSELQAQCLVSKHPDNNEKKIQYYKNGRQNGIQILID